MKTSLCRVARSFDDRRNWLKAAGLGMLGALLGQSVACAGKAGKKSVQLHIYIEAKPGMDKKLEKLYREAYVSAIKVQKGFLFTRLLRHYESSTSYEIDISFETEAQRAAWAGSKEHPGGLAEDRSGSLQDHLARLRRAGLSRRSGYRRPSCG